MTNTPEKTTANALLKQHGPTGYLILRLQRNARLGWALFVITLFGVFGLEYVRAVVPGAVLVVNEKNQVVGNIEYLKPTARSDEDLLAGAQEFTKHYLSLDSSTIFEDYSLAMNMMCPEMFEQAKAAIQKSSYLKKIESAKTQSRLEYAHDAARPVVVKRNGLDAQVQLRGNLITSGTGTPVATPFDVMVDLRIVARNTQNTAGLCVAQSRDL